MSESRDRMIRSLKGIVIPALRAKGFQGSVPHFRRVSTGRLDILSFQFDRHGGGFIVEISYCPPEGIITYWGEAIQPRKVDVGYIHPDRRIRLGSTPGDANHWFRYDAPLCPPDIYEQLAREVLDLIETQAEPWWAERD